MTAQIIRLHKQGRTVHLPALILAGRHIVATEPEGPVSPENFDDLVYWEDREAAKKITGIFANRIFVQPLGDGLMRLNFGEVLDEEPTYHTAIVVSASNAVDFAQLVYQMAQALLAPPPIVRTNTASPEVDQPKSDNG